MNLQKKGEVTSSEIECQPRRLIGEGESKINQALDPTKRKEEAPQYYDSFFDLIHNDVDN